MKGLRGPLLSPSLYSRWSALKIHVYICVYIYDTHISMSHGSDLTESWHVIKIKKGRRGLFLSPSFFLRWSVLEIRAS